MFRYREKHRVCCDVIPYYINGEYHLFFLNGYADGSGWSRSQTPWSHLMHRTPDCLYKLPDAIEPGAPSQADGHACFTGSVIHHDGTWHIYYTGFAPLHPDGRERIMHATSVDGVHFTKDDTFTPLVPDHHYYGADEDFRDPFVFWHEADQCFCMTVTAGAFSPISNCQRGVVGLLTSTDLLNWAYQPPIYAPDSYMPMECTDLFVENGRWYMLFSQYMHTEYRYADSLYGPWHRPKNPCLDGGKMAFYAAKSLYDGKRHLLYGWCGTQEGNVDREACQWGGDIISPRELFADSDGELSQRFAQDMLATYPPIELNAMEMLGSWQKRDTDYCHQPKSGLSVLRLDTTCQNRHLDMHITSDDQSGWLYVFLSAADDLSTYYALRIDTATGEVCFIRNGYRPSIYGAVTDGLRMLGRQVLTQKTNGYHIQLISGDGIVETIVDNRAVLTLRMDDFPDGNLCVGAEHVNAEFSPMLYQALPAQIKTL